MSMMTMELIRWNISVLFLYALCAIKIADGACNWPASLGSLEWVDSTQGNVTFSATTMQGWTVSISSDQSVSEWECVSNSNFDSSGRLIMISTSTVQIFSVDYYVYMCLTFSSITSDSYRYYVNNAKQENANNQRAFPYYVSNLVDEGTLCDDTNGAQGAEYHVMIKSGSEATSKLDCPWAFLGRYGYTHTAVGGTTTCASSTSQLDTCTNNNEMSFDYTTCTTKVAYSVSDTVWCVDNVDISGANYVMLYNGNDADSVIDDTTVFRFTCMAIASDGESASVSPQHCQTGQTPGDFPVNSAGNQIGAKLTLASPTATCPSLVNPDRGTVSIATNGAVTSGLYTCNSNYTMHGSSSRTCQDSGNWTSTEPYCSCATPAVPTNGALSINSLGTVVSYTCELMYSLDGSETRSCQLDSASWDSTDPSCTQCAAIPAATGRITSTTTSGTSTSASFTCSSGYNRIGVASVTCLATGQWDSDIPTCVSCTVLTNPASGNVAVSSNGITSTATYTCSSGYSLVGSTMRTCQDDGSWDGSAPTCSCNTPTTPSNGAVVSDGTTATYTCNVNYTLSGDSTRTCQPDGTGWGNSDPSCAACSAISVVDGGAVTLSTTGTVTSARYSCDSGYSLDGTSTITCQTDGTWDSSIPQCVQCPNLNNPDSGIVSITTSGTTSAATYACASGYDINGITIRLCSATGSWSQTAPTCTCQSPTSPTNGAVTADGESATYTCNSGYSLNGVSSRTCATDGSGWSESDPTCSTCATLNTPTGGSVTTSTDGINTQATYTCNTGYTLNGVSLITCRNDGTWDYSQPTCAQCPDLSNPSSGSVVLSSTGTVTTGTYSCSSGYYLSGTMSVTCNTDGTWDNTPPTCSCNFPPTPSNGGVSVSDSSSGTFATYTCNTGYSLSGLTSRTCQTDGTGWEGTDPSCTQCQTVTAPASGSLSLSSNGTSTSLSFTCNQGSTLNGATSLICLSTGTYDNNVPTCASCPTLSNPLSGSVALATDGYVTTATFTCVSGYSLTSGGTLTCITAGTWDITEPTCNCQSPPSISNGNWTLATNQSTVTYACATGYVLTGSNTRHCQTDGTGWDGTEPTCNLNTLNTGASTEGDSGLSVPAGVVIAMAILLVILLVVVVVVTYLYITLRKRNKRVGSAEPDRRPIKPERQCNTLQTPTGGSIAYGSDGSTTSANYSCSAGYNLVGDGLLTCEQDQTWDKTSPSCVKCTNLNNPYGGQVSIATDGYVSVASYSCPSGYYIVGTETRTCSASGSWDSSDPSCECSDPATPTNGEVTANGITATYTCDLSYTLIGSQSRSCLSDGTGWGDTDPSCTQCSNLASPVGGSYQISTTGTVTSASFTCDLGYTISGSTTLTCGTDGSWGTQPTCAQCTTLPDIDSGSIVRSTNGYITMATYSCDSGYDLSGSAVRSCSTDGSWTLSAPTCTCQSPSTPQNGYLSENGVSATYGCNVGFSLSGSSTRTCANDGSGWSGSDPLCNMCNGLNTPSGGTLTTTTDGIQTTASFTCGVGYTLNGPSSVTCDSDGTWSAAEPQCVACPTLSDPSSGAVSVETDGQTTVGSYTCESGYYVSGTQSVTCGTDGQWTDAAPTCKCNIPATPANGAVSVSDGATGPEADYSCTVGYSLSGSATRLCQSNGQGWASTDPECVICATLTTPTDGSVSLITDGLQTHALVTCSVGFTINGARNMTCRSDGSWDFTEPTCFECQDLSSPSSGSVTLATDNYITTASFTCVSGYYVSGALSVTCGTDGQWSDTSPTCKCNIPAAPADGSVSVSDGTDGPEAYYTCNLGYSIDGSAKRLCQSNGQGWDSSDPVCQLCPTIAAPQNTEYSLSSNGTTTSVTYTCPVNYTLDGISVHTCDGTGTWDHSTPTCVHCSAVTSPSSGSVAISTDGITTTATFSCVFGYSLNSTSVTTCQADGTWNLPEPACVCDPPSAIANGDIVLSTDGRIANYSCSAGYQLSGSAQRFCIDDGTGWNGTNPRCDSISARPSTDASTEEKVSLPLAVFIVMLIVILGLIAGFSLFIYCRFKMDRSKISAEFEGSETSQPIEERASDLNSPKDIESGKAALIGRQGEKKLVFNVRKLKPTTSLKSGKKTAVKESQSNGTAKSIAVTNSMTEVEDVPTVISMPNGSPQNVPIQSVRLPKLPPRPPQDHQQKTKKPQIKRKRKPQKPKDTNVEPRTSTPLEIQMARTKTPEILSSVEFGYISPQYCYEADTPVGSRPTTSFSGKSIRTDTGISIDLDASKNSAGQT